MNKSLKIIGILIILIAVAFGVQFFMSSKKIENHSTNQTDTLLIKNNINYIIENLNNEVVLKEFSDENFPDKKQLKSLIADISTKCDWKKRVGGIIDSYHTKNIDGVDQVAYIYEFKMECGQLNFIMTYNMDKENAELFRFDFEPLMELDQTPATSKL